MMIIIESYDRKQTGNKMNIKHDTTLFFFATNNYWDSGVQQKLTDIQVNECITINKIFYNLSQQDTL